MVYIYDLVLNWCDKKRYEFFEWDDNDEIEYIKRIPVFRINNLSEILDSKIKVNMDFLNKIYNKTEVYGNKKVEKVEYACVLCDSLYKKAIAIEFNGGGESIYRSNIYFYDLDDVFLLSKKIDSFNLVYEVINGYENRDFYLTREEIKKKFFLVNEINNSYFEKDIDKLKYLYYEFFCDECDDINVIRNRLLESLNNNFTYKHNDIYELMKIPNF